MAKMLPVPKDPNYQAPEISEAQFNNPNAPDTDDLLEQSGEWDNYEDEDDKGDGEDCDLAEDDDDFFNNLMTTLWAINNNQPKEWHGTRPLTRSDITGDRLAIDRASVRTVDDDGRLHIAKTPISKANVCPYYGSEIPGYDELGLEPDKIYNLWRHPDELKKAASTFNGVPLLDDHEPTSADDHPHDKVAGAVGNEAVFEHPYLYNSLVIWPGESIKGVKTGEKRQLSSGYKYRPEMTPGVTPDGEKFDGIMRDIIGNHVALVQEGRAGPDVVVGDTALGETNMANRHARRAAESKMRKAVEAVRSIAKDASIEQVTELLDALKGKDEDKPPMIEGSAETPAPAVDAEDPAAVAIKEMLNGRLSDEEMAKLGELLGQLGPAIEKHEEAEMAGVDEEDPGLEKTEEKELARAKEVEIPEGEAHDEDDEDKKDDKDMVTKTAMDAALRAARSEAVSETMNRLNAIREAERLVKPLVGEVSLGLDSADAIYEKTLKTFAVDTKGVHPSAFPAMVKMLVEKQAAKPVETSPIAMDGSTLDSFYKMFPGAARIN